MDFRTAMLEKVERDQGVLKKSVVRLIRRAESAPPERREKIYKRLEDHARLHLGIAGEAKVDWAVQAVDWNKLLELIKMLLPLILALFGA